MRTANHLGYITRSPAVALLYAMGLSLCGPASCEELLRLKHEGSFGAWLEHAWDEPPLSKGFVKASIKPARAADPAAVATEVRVALLSDGLGFAIRCAEPGPEKIVAEYGPHHHDASLMPGADDCVEVLIDANHGWETAFGIAINTKGAVLDAIYYPRGYVDRTWESHVKPQVSGSALIARVPRAARPK